MAADLRETNGMHWPASAKPPFLRRVQIRGYKSIAFCDVTLEPLTILVGRNASGKRVVSQFEIGFFFRSVSARSIIETSSSKSQRWSVTLAFNAGGIRNVACRVMKL